MREIVLDTETTGFDPFSGDRIVEIGCVELVNRVPTGEVYHQYINPERDMPEEAFRVHGLGDDFLKDFPVFEAVAGAFRDFLGDAKLVIHNASFDMKFINAEFSWIGMDEIPMRMAIDTVQMAREKFPGSPANLDALCRRFGIENDHRTYHGALLDSELLAEVYLELTGGRQPGLLLSDKANAQSVSALSSLVSDINGTAKEIRPAREHGALSEEEIKAHEGYLSHLTDPIWHKYQA